jgi:hypothetical protein
MGGKTTLFFSVMVLMEIGENNKGITIPFHFI